MSEDSREEMTNTAQINVIQSHLDKGEWQQAEKHCRTVPKEQAGNPEILRRLGIALYFQQKQGEAIDPLKQCVEQNPGDNEAQHWLLAAYRDANDTANAYETALKLRNKPWMPDDELSVFEAFEDACAWHDAAKIQKRALALTREGKITVEQIPYLMILLNHVPDVSPAIIYDIYRVWGDTIMQRSGTTRLATEIPPPPPDSRLKIAYLSADFRGNHPIGKFMRTIFASHNHHLFEVYCYVHKLDDDAVTDEIRLASDHFIEITDLDNEALARRIHADGIHILIEIGNHMAHSRLEALAWQPAPVQINYLAEPNTSALPTVDFRITDAHSEAPDGTRYIEKQLYMPESFLCMGHLPDFDRIATTPAEQNGYITFCSFNGVRKFNPAVIAVWSKILKRVKKSKLVIKSPGIEVPIVRSNLLKEFKRNGIGEERLELVGYCSWQEHADWHNKIDIALDSFPYNGTTTTFDTLWMGVPVVTLVGALHAQRTSYTILKNIGFDEAAAAFTPEEYVNKAVHLAKHPETLSFLRRCLPTMIRNSIMFQPERFTAQLEHLYVRAWKEKMGSWQRPSIEHVDWNAHAKDNSVNSSVTHAPLRRIFIAGMPRAGTAWLHWVATAIIKRNNDKEEKPKVQFLYAPSGEASRAIISEDTVVFYARRDLRDAVIALMDIYHISFEEVLQDEYLQNLTMDDHTWVGFPQTHPVRYEDIVDNPEQVIQSVATCMGYTINANTAQDIAEYCLKSSDTIEIDYLHKEMDNPESAPAQASESVSNFTNDPPGIYLSRLSPEQVGRLNIEFRPWLEAHNYLVPTYPDADASKVVNIKMQDGLSVYAPATLAQRSTYMLLEQEDWCEPEIHFLRQWIALGMRCADIGAGFGIFTLTMSQHAGSKGEVWALEASEHTADILHKNIEINNLEHCHLIRMIASDQRGETLIHIGEDEISICDDEASEFVTQQTADMGLIDDLATTHEWTTLDIIRINVGRDTNRALEGGRNFFQNSSPLVMLRFAESRTKTQHTDTIHYMLELGYSAYKLIPQLMLLTPYNPKTEGEMLNHIFFCKKDREKKLRQDSLLINSEYASSIRLPKANAWEQFSCQFPYVERLASEWNQDSENNAPEHKTYIGVLNIYAAAWKKDTATQNRLAQLQHAFAIISDILSAHTNLPRLLTLARIAIDLNKRDTAYRALDSVIRHLSEGNQFIPEEPFLTASTWAETIDPCDHPAEWCLAQAIHARIKHGETSSWYTRTSDIALLDTFRQCGFPNAEMERRHQLILMRCGLQDKPSQYSESMHVSTNNMDFWQGDPTLLSSPTLEFAQSADKLPCLCSLPTTGSVPISVVLEHYFQRPIPYADNGGTDIIAFRGNKERAIAIRYNFMRNIQTTGRLVYIHQDPRDVLIALFEKIYKKTCAKHPEEFTNFIQKQSIIWKEDADLALSYKDPKCIVRYHDIVESPYEEFYKIILFIHDGQVDKNRLHTSLKCKNKSTVDVVTRLSGNTPATEKCVNTWQKLMTSTQIALVQNIIGSSLLEKLGYLIVKTSPDNTTTTEMENRRPLGEIPHMEEHLISFSGDTNRPMFSIIIPTRERHDTLESAIASALHQQDYANYEIVVMDNYGSGKTRDVAMSFADPKIKYFRSPERLAMHDNWEMALQHSRGDYVFFLGDDDAVMPDALTIAHRLLEKHDVKIISWNKPTYWWGNSILPYHKNKLYVALSITDEVMMDSREELKKLFQFQTGYDLLPGVYNSFVHRDILYNVQAIHKRYFMTPIPDVFSSIINAYFSTRYLHITRGLSLSGNSRHSTGCSQMWPNLSSTAKKTFENENNNYKRKDLPKWLPSRGMVTCMPLLMAEELLTIKQLFFPKDADFDIQPVDVVNALAGGINHNTDIYDQTLDDIKTMAKACGLSIDLSAIPAKASGLPAPFQGFTGDSNNVLAINCEQAGIHNAANAARLIQSMWPSYHA